MGHEKRYWLGQRSGWWKISRFWQQLSSAETDDTR